MENFNFYSPTEFVFGKDRECEVGKYVKKFGGSKVLIHYGSGSAVKSGLIDRVKKSLDAEGLPYLELGGVKPNPRDVMVYEGIELCRNEGIDFILAVGGGSVIDSAKAIAVGVPYDGDFWDFYSGKAVIQSALGVATVLTIAAKGIEAFRSFLHNIGMPVNFDEIGAKREDIPTLVDKFGLGEDGRTGGFVSLSSKDVEAIYNIAADYTM